MLRNLILRLLGIQPEKVIIVRLEQSVMNDLRRRVNGTCMVTTQTTDLQAGYQLGMAHVLNVLQEGYVTTRS